MWLLYAVAAAVLIATSFLLVKKANLTQIPVHVFTFYMWGVASALLLGYLVYIKQPLGLPGRQIFLVGFAGFIFLLGGMLLNTAVYTAPNPAYATAIASIQIVIVAVASFILFGSQLTLLKAGGIFLMLLGAGLLVL